MNTDLKKEKSEQFAVRIVQLCQYLQKEKCEFVLSKQILRSGTSIGANIAESEFAQSSADFHSKLSIALKEVGETRYWLKILYRSCYIDKNTFDSYLCNCQELIRILVSIIKKQVTQI